MSGTRRANLAHHGFLRIFLKFSQVLDQHSRCELFWCFTGARDYPSEFIDQLGGPNAIRPRQVEQTLAQVIKGHFDTGNTQQLAVLIA